MSPIDDDHYRRMLGLIPDHLERIRREIDLADTVRRATTPLADPYALGTAGLLAERQMREALGGRNEYYSAISRSVQSDSLMSFAENIRKNEAAMRLIPGAQDEVR